MRDLRSWRAIPEKRDASGTLWDRTPARCERRDEPLTDSQRFTLLTASQLALDDWRAPRETRTPS
jgi:hypothetical protein